MLASLRRISISPSQRERQPVLERQQLLPEGALFPQLDQGPHPRIPGPPSGHRESPLSLPKQLILMLVSIIPKLRGMFARPSQSQWFLHKSVPVIHPRGNSTRDTTLQLGKDHVVASLRRPSRPARSTFSSKASTIPSPRTVEAHAASKVVERLDTLALTADSWL